MRAAYVFLGAVVVGVATAEIATVAAATRDPELAAEMKGVVTDSLRFVDSSLVAETNRPYNLAVRKTVVRSLAAIVRRLAARADSIALAQVPDTVIIGPPPPSDTTPPPPQTTITLTLTGDTLRIRPELPYIIFVDVDVAGQQISDSASFSVNDTTLARLYWLPAQRRLQVYTTVADSLNPGGTLYLTAHFATATATRAITVLPRSGTAPPPATPQISSIEVFAPASPIGPLPSMKVGDTLDICGLYRMTDGSAGLLPFTDTPADTIGIPAIDTAAFEPDWTRCRNAALQRLAGVPLTRPARYGLLASSDTSVAKVGVKPRIGSSGLLPAPRRFMGRTRIG